MPLLTPRRGWAKSTVLAAALLALPACGVSQLGLDARIAGFKSVVDDSIADTVRRERAATTVQKVSDITDQLSKDVERLREEIFELTCDYDATRAAMDAKYAELDRLRDVAGGKIVDVMISLREDVTLEEWATIYANLDKD